MAKKTGLGKGLEALFSSPVIKIEQDPELLIKKFLSIRLAWTTKLLSTSAVYLV